MMLSYPSTQKPESLFRNKRSIDSGLFLPYAGRDD